MMTSRILCLAAVFCLVAATPMFAQDGVAHPAAERGRHSIVVDIGGGPQIGLWARQSTRTDLGLDLAATAQLRDDSRHLSVRFTPAIKRYLASSGPLAPYVFFGIPLGYTRSVHENVDAPDNTQQGYGVGATTGLGLDWFPISRVSIGGHVGLEGQYVHWDDADNDTLQLGTTSSGIRVHLYF